MTILKIEHYSRVVYTPVNASVWSGVGASGSEFATRPKRLSKCSQMAGVSNSHCWVSPTRCFLLKPRDEHERPAPSPWFRWHTVCIQIYAKSKKYAWYSTLHLASELLTNFFYHTIPVIRRRRCICASIYNEHVSGPLANVYTRTWIDNSMSSRSHRCLKLVNVKRAFSVFEYTSCNMRPLGETQLP